MVPFAAPSLQHTHSIHGETSLDQSFSQSVRIVDSFMLLFALRFLRFRPPEFRGDRINLFLQVLLDCVTFN